MKISEMSLEQLQDYALSLEGQVAGLNADLESVKNQNAEFVSANLALQQRNNRLLMQVEQQGTPIGADPAEPPPADPPQSCEDFAIKNIEEIMKV